MVTMAGRFFVNSDVLSVCTHPYRPRLCKHLLSGRVSLIYLIADTALNTGLIGVLCPQGVYPIHWGRATGTFCPQGVPLSVQSIAAQRDRKVGRTKDLS